MRGGGGGLYQACFDVCDDSVLHCLWRPGLWLPAQLQDRRVGISSLPTSSYLAINLPTRVSGYIRHLAPVCVWGMGGGGEKEGSYCAEGRGEAVIYCGGGGGEIVMMVEGRIRYCGEGGGS